MYTNIIFFSIYVSICCANAVNLNNANLSVPNPTLSNQPSATVLPINPNGYEEVKKSKDFTGKVLLCTGSSSGIGKEVTKLFSYLGASVVVTGRNPAKVQKAAKEVLDVSPNRLKPLEVVADVTKRDDLIRLVDETIKTFGKIDILINNAGIHKSASIRDPNFMQVFDETFAVDVRAVVELIQIALPYLQKTNGTIINTASRNALRPAFNKTAYSSAKAAIILITQVLALELGPSAIRVNTISPGNTEDAETFGSPEQTNQILSPFIKDTPLGRNGKPLDVAKGFVFLASSDASFITGANLIIDGGFHFNAAGN